MNIHKTVSDEKRVAPDFFNFVIGEVIGVPSFGHVSCQIDSDLLLQEQRVPVFSQPVDQYIRSIRWWEGEDDFLINFLRYLYPPKSTHCCQPVPKLPGPFQ